jgi:replicative DNA helicase
VTINVNISGFKSGLLISLVYWFKLYNKGFKTKKNKIPTILYITLENSVEETVERIFNMAVTADDIRNYSVKDVVRLLKEEGQFIFNGKGDINIIIQYYNNREINTADLYNIIEDLEDDNKEVICLILDYLKRIRPRERSKDEKEELKNVTNELKSLANDFDIAVITAHQLNREGAKVVDNAAVTNKEDLGRFLGRGHTGSACDKWAA